MLIPESEWPSLRRRAQSQTFKTAVRRLRQDVNAFLDRPIDIPSEPAGYYHDYFCAEHGCQLTFNSATPTVHRCPVDGVQYEGTRYDAAWRWSANNLLSESAIRLALRWRLEENPVYLKRVADTLTGYAARYADYRRVERSNTNPGVATYTTLDKAVWLIPLTWAFDLVRPALSQEQAAAIADQLLAPAAEYLVQRHYGGIHNFSCWHNAAIGTVGLVLDRPDLTDFAVDGEFGFHAQLCEGVLSDGLWFEGSVSYHFYALAGLLAQAKATYHISDLDLRSHPTLHAMLSAPIQCAYPDGSLPAPNDCWYFTSLLGDCCHGVPPAPAFYEIGYAWYDDAHFARVLHSAYGHILRDSLDALLFGKDEIPPAGLQPQPSVNLSGSGYAILRSPPPDPESDPEDQQYLLLKYGPHGGGHGHPDKLSLILYAHGRRLAPDLGTPGYGLDLFQTWYRQTLSHNTATLDGLSQPPAQGQLHRFRSEGPFQLADAGVTWDSGPYGGVSMRRVILTRPDYFLDLFLVEPDRPRRIDWIYRTAGACETSLDLEPVAIAGEGDGYEHLTSVYRANSNSDFVSTWQSDGAGLRCFVPGFSGAEILTGLAPGNPPTDLHTTLIQRRHTRTTAFLSVFHPHTHPPRITSVDWTGRDLMETGWAGCTVHLPDASEHWTLRLTPDTVAPPGPENVDGHFEYFLKNVAGAPAR